MCVCVCQHFFEVRLREQERIIHYYLREGGRGQGLKTCLLTINKVKGENIPPIPSGPSRYLLSIKILFRIAHVNRSLVIRFSSISLHSGNKIIVMNNKPT